MVRPPDRPRLARQGRRGGAAHPVKRFGPAFALAQRPAPQRQRGTRAPRQVGMDHEGAQFGRQAVMGRHGIAGLPAGAR